MYGLMKAHICSRHGEQAQRHRLHYCGTCKTMGRLYGQKSRFLLNNDAVFLAELLTALSPTPDLSMSEMSESKLSEVVSLEASLAVPQKSLVSADTSTWGRAYRSYNCFALPVDEAEMPLALQIAATVTLIMTEFKVTDQIADTGGRGWKLAHRVFSPGFLAAAERMKTWGFPVDTVWRWGGMQDDREREASEKSGVMSALEIIASVAEPTAKVTGLVFQYGAAAVETAANGIADQDSHKTSQNRQVQPHHPPVHYGVNTELTSRPADAWPKATQTGTFSARRAFSGEHPILKTTVSRQPPATIDHNRQKIQETMFALGYAFGTLVYVLDAYEDYVKDVRKGDFNALQAAFRTQETELPDCHYEAIRDYIDDLRVQVEMALRALPLPAEQATLLTTRLRTNLARRLGETAEAGTCSPRTQRPSLRAQWKSALSLARTLTARYRAQRSTLLSHIAQPFIFLWVLLVAMIFPQQTRTATSYQECTDIAFNLIFLTAALKSLFSAPMRLIPAFASNGFASNNSLPNNPVQHGVSLSVNDPAEGEDDNIRQGQSGIARSSSGRRSSTSTSVVRVRRGFGPPGCCCACDDCCCQCAICEAEECCCNCACESCSSC